MLSSLLKVGGIGDGLFVIFFFVGLSVLICLLGMRTSQPGLFCIIAVVISLFIILFMVLVPKAPPGGYVDPNIYDNTAKFRTGVAAVLGISCIITLVLLCGQVLLQPIQGSRIRQS